MPGGRGQQEQGLAERITQGMRGHRLKAFLRAAAAHAARLPAQSGPPGYPVCGGLCVFRHGGGWISPMGPVKGAGAVTVAWVGDAEKRVVGALVAEQSRGQVAGAWRRRPGSTTCGSPMIGAISQACSLPVTTASDAEYISLARVICMQSAQPTQIVWPALIPASLPDDGTRC
jgi:hypothetical protein